MDYENDPIGCRYASGDDIRTKLNGCFVMYDGKPVVVRTNEYPDYKDLQLVECDDAGNYTSATKVSVLDGKFNQYDFNFGWTNIPSRRGASRHVAFGERSPVRRYKQGLTCESVFFNSPNADGGFTRYQPSTGELVAMMRGEYPTLADSVVRLRNEALKNTVDSHVGVALSPSVALIIPFKASNDFALVYAEKMCVGRYHFDGRTLESTKQGMYSIVSRFLHEVGIE
jgi:hypothetical protein